MIGRTDLLERATDIPPRSKAATLDLSPLLEPIAGVNYQQMMQQHHLEQGFDLSSLYYDAQIAIKEGQHFEGTYVIHNEQRDVGVITGSTITEYYGPDGLPEDTIIVKHLVMLGKV